MATIKTIKPAGGGDYTTLQAWEDWADDQASADQWAECYEGGDMGALTIQTWASTPTAGLYPRVYTPLAERHDGTCDVGAYTTGVIYVIDVDYVRVEGIRLDGVTASPILGGSFNSTMNSLLLDSNLIETTTGAVGSGIGLTLNSIGAVATGTFTIQNNIIHSRSTSGGMYGIKCQAESIIGNNPTLQVYAYNNTIVMGEGTSGPRYGMLFEEVDGAGNATVNATVTNNIVVGSFTNDYAEINHDSGTITGSYNLSSDSTGTLWGSTGAIIGTGAGNLFVNSECNWDLQNGAPAIDAGTTIGSFDWDAIHITGDNWRPQGTAWDMGAMETTNSKHRPRGISTGLPFNL